jgi:hypothetical protein
MAYELADEEDEALTKPRTQIQTPKKKMYKTQEVLAVAFAAQAKNGSYVKVTERFNEPENKTRFANKELVKLHYAEPSQWIPPDYVPLIVTEDDYENVDVAIKHFRRYTLGVIGDQLFGREDFDRVFGGRCNDLRVDAHRRFIDIDDVDGEVLRDRATVGAGGFDRDGVAGGCFVVECSAIG